MSDNKNDNYRILNLHSENIKRIKTVDITPDRNVVILEGKNAQGKSSVLDSIAYALGGKGLMPKNPVRSGEETAKITVDIGDFLITRHWTDPEKSYLKIENKNGLVVPSPQGFLQKIVGNLAFDPLEFINYDKKKRIEILKKISGIGPEIERLDKVIEEKVEERKFAKKEVDRLKGAVVQYSDVPLEATTDIVSVDKLQADYETAVEHNAKIKEAERGIEYLESAIKAWEDEIHDLNTRINNALHDIEDLKANIAKRGPAIDTESMKRDIAQVMAQSEMNNKRMIKAELIKQLADAVDHSETLEEVISLSRQERDRVVGTAVTSVPGLSVGTEDVLFDGVEFSEASQAEQIRISMAIAMAENPKVKIVLLSNGSLLDNDSMDMVKKIAMENDYQIWVERVSSGKSSGDVIYIEEGEVV